MTDDRDKQISEARFHKLFDDTQAMSIQGYRADGTVVYWNAASEKIYGYTTAEALGQSLYDLIIPPDMRDDVHQAVAWMFEHKQGIPSARLNLKHKNGTTVPVFSSHTVVALPNDEPIMFCMDADMRALEIAENQVQRLSYFDPLTDLPNRRLLLERLTSILRPNNGDTRVAALMIIDIDNFHSINESLGYTSGDRVLMHCAQCLQQFAPAPDDIARLGKDEFVLLLASAGNSSAAVSTNAILPIGDWVLEQSCLQLVQWASQADTKRLNLSVNVSSEQFRRGDFVSRVQQILLNSGANPKNLRLELTESLMAEDIEFVVSQMHNLRELGVSISLDDFGTGYASLAYLSQLPLDELKIDRAFVKDLNKQGKGELLTETLISLGRSMNLTVIAEGVETHEQFERLQELGCEFFQGYLFGKPRTDVESYLNQKS
ncbi:MAG: hypothetical protein CMF22_08230 [Idiomarinaceae bacterium]|nr:hypothetical protein [Idiomarinaceae bacterium]